MKCGYFHLYCTWDLKGYWRGGGEEEEEEGERKHGNSHKEREKAREVAVIVSNYSLIQISTVMPHSKLPIKIEEGPTQQKTAMRKAH